MPPRIAVCLTSHDRLDCARINQEIFKLNFKNPYVVVHASSGAGAQAYLEDAFVPCPPLPHFAGALSLMRNAIGAAAAFAPDLLVVLDGDVWLLKEDMLLAYIRRLQEDPRSLIATCAWSTPPRSRLQRLAREVKGIVLSPEDRLRRLASIPRRMRYDAVDFCTQCIILRNDRSLLELFCGMRPDGRRLVERLWFDRFTAYYGFERVVRMREREPVHPHQRFACEQLGLHGEHWPAAGTSRDPGDARLIEYIHPDTPGKREALERCPHIRTGESIQRLLNADSFDYYNRGAKRY